MAAAGNIFLNAQEYANVMLLLLKNQLVWGKLVDGQFKDEVTDENGLTINVKRPPRFIDAKDGTANLVLQDLVVGSAPVSVNQYSKVHIAIGDIEYIQSYNALMQNETMKSAASTLAHSIDLFIANQTLNFASWIAGAVASAGGSTNATDPTKGIASAAEAMGAHTRLMAQGVPNSSLSGVLAFKDGEMIRGSLLSSYTPQINVSMLEKVRIPLISEIDWFATQQLPNYTTGTRTQGDGASTGATVNGANQNVNYRDVSGSPGVTGMTQTLSITGGGAAATIAAGEVFTIQNVFAYDWRAQKIRGELAQFTVLNAVTLNGSGAGTVTITPPIIVQGTNDEDGNSYANSAFGTVGTIPASGAYIQWAGAASTKLTVRAAFHKRAISLVSARLHMPFTGVASYAVDPDTGISVRYWRGSDITTGAHIHRWDCMYGSAVMDQYLGTRVCGT
jgi:hypothetical protein